MKYPTAHAFNAALGSALLARSESSGVSLDRLRRRILVERLMARIVHAEPGIWVLKGGMALEVRGVAAGVVVRQAETLTFRSRPPSAAARNHRPSAGT